MTNEDITTLINTITLVWRKSRLIESDFLRQNVENGLRVALSCARSMLDTVENILRKEREQQ